jgi:hypothetical protein
MGKVAFPKNISIAKIGLDQWDLFNADNALFVPIGTTTQCF